ncbi:MAG: type II toxin-antitoxin system PemK/MazF family toxin [Cyanobacteria bacterium J06554_3]
MAVDFPGVTGLKRRPALVLSSHKYHAVRPDFILGLITSQSKRLGVTDCILEEWAKAGLRKPSVFRSFIVTLPPSANLVRIGRLAKEDWQHVCQCLAISLEGMNST